MLPSLTILLLCQLAGEALVRLSGLPLPGPVVGMVILFLGLVVRGRVPAQFESSVRAIFTHFLILFIPASVGVMVHVKTIEAEILPIAAAILGSLIITMVVTGRLMQALSGGKPPRQEKDAS